MFCGRKSKEGEKDTLPPAIEATIDTGFCGAAAVEYTILWDKDNRCKYTEYVISTVFDDMLVL